MPSPKQPPLPLIQSPQELLALSSQPGLFRLSRMQSHIRRPHHKRPPQNGAQLPLVKEIQHAHRHAVKVRALVSQRHGSRVGFQRGLDLVGQAGRQGQGQRRLGVFARGGEGEHFGEPEGEREAGAGFEAIGIVEMAEVRHVELEATGDFLDKVSFQSQHCVELLCPGRLIFKSNTYLPVGENGVNVVVGHVESASRARLQRASRF